MVMALLLLITLWTWWVCGRNGAVRLYRMIDDDKRWWWWWWWWWW